MFAKSIVTKGGDVFRDEYSLAFDGSNDYVHTNFVASNEGITNDVTVSCWFKAADLAASSNAFVWNFYQSTSDGFGVKFSSSTFKIIADIDNADANLYTTTLDINKWYLAVVVIDSLEVKLYINGVLEGSGTSVADGLDSFTSNFYIANRKGAAGTGEFNGNISEIAIYNSALTANQVKTIYNGREPYNHKEGVASGNLQAWYRMGDGVLDDFNLIGDETNATLGSDVLSGSTWNDTDANWSESGGVVTASGATGTAYITSVLTQGKTYKIVYTASVTSGSFRFLIGGTNGNLITSSGDYVEYKVCTSSNHINIDGVSSFTGNVSNITVQQVGDNAGLMTNMEAIDFEGDTP